MDRSYGFIPVIQHAQTYAFAEMDLRHTQAVGRLHAAYMPNSLLSDLGAEVLDVLYACLLDAHYGVGYVILKENRVLGFSFGRFCHAQSLLKTVLGSWRCFVGPLLKLCFKHPVVLPKIVVRLMQADSEESRSDAGELVAIVMDQEARGSTASQETAQLLFERLRREGCRTVFWETLAENVPAQKFYDKMGGRVMEERRVGGQQILWYEKNLDV